MAANTMSRALERYEQVRATAHSLAARDLALLVVRLCLAWIFVYHGAGTLFGAFGGAGLHNEAVFYANYAHLHPGTLFAVLGGTIECFGGAAIGLGVFGRLAGAGLVGDMVMAMITVTFTQGIVGNPRRPRRHWLPAQYCPGGSGRGRGPPGNRATVARLRDS